MQTRIILYIITSLFLFPVHSYLQTVEVMRPDKFNPSGQYPLYIAVNCSFDKELLTQYVKKEQILFLEREKLFPDGNKLDEVIWNKNTDRSRVALLAEGIEGFRFILRNPLRFSAGMIILGKDDIVPVYEEIKNNQLLPENAAHEHIYLVIPDDAPDSQADNLEDLINKKDHPIRIKKNKGPEQILDLCDGQELKKNIKAIDFKVDDLRFSQCAWLKVLGKRNQLYHIKAKVNDDQIDITSDSADSFEIDFNYPVFKDIDKDDMITVKFNSRITHYGTVPDSKILVIQNKVMISSKRGGTAALDSARKNRNKAVPEKFIQKKAEKKTKKEKVVIPEKPKISKPKTNLIIKKEKKKLSIVMQDLLFKKNSADLRKDARNILGRVIRILDKNKKLTRNIMIEGHTDDTGTRDFNIRLSMKRVQNYLINNGGVEKSTIRATGYGDTLPAYPNDTESNRRKNRRVNIVLHLK